MDTKRNLEFTNASELSDYIMKMHELNPEKDTDAILNKLADMWASIKWKWELLEIWKAHPDFYTTIVDYVDKKMNEWKEEVWDEVLNPEPDKYNNDMDFFQATKTSDWWSMTWQEKAEILAENYNSILNKAKEKAKQTYWLAWEWLKKANDELDWYREQLKTIEQSPEFEQLMKDLAEWGTWRLFDNWIVNSNVNQTLKMIASWKWSQLFASWDRLKNWADAIKTSWIWKFANEYSETPWRQWPAWSIFWWEDVQDIAKAYLEEKTKNNRINKSSNTKEDKRNKTKEKSSLNLNPDNESPLNWEEENETKDNKKVVKNTNKRKDKKNTEKTRVAQSSSTITNLLKRKS